jgi:phosphoglycolate phosphatase
MKYDTIIFDLDGTLLNTLDDLRDSVNYMLEKNGFPQRSLDEIRRFVGHGVRNLVQLALPKEVTEDELTHYLSEFKEHYSHNMQNKTRPYNDIKELLLLLNKKNYKIAIVSNKFDAAVKSLARDYFDNLIPVAIGESPEVKKKPAPDSVYTAVRELGVELKTTIYVGDSETDVQTAKNAGVPCIGVTWGFRDRDVLKEAGADYIIDKPMELFTII